MVRRCGTCLASVVVLTSLTLGRPAGAVIRVDLPVSKIYATAKTVVVGQVVGLNPDHRVADVKVDQTVKGEPPGDRLRVQVVSPEEVFKEVVAGQPVVLFAGEDQGRPVAVVHLADKWLFAHGVPEARVPLWRIVKRYDEAAPSFPGRTAALARLVGELKAGRSSIQDETRPEAFEGAVRELAALAVKPTFLAATDVNGDGQLDLLVGTAAGVRLFLATPKGFADATSPWGLDRATGAHCALGDVNADGKTDLLLGSTLWLRGDNGFTPAKAALELPPESEWLVVTLADATGDTRPDVAVLRRTGSLHTLANPGSPDKPWPPTPRNLWEGGEIPGAAAFSTEWGDNGEPHVLVVRERSITRYPVGPGGGAPAEFERLTGTTLARCKGLSGRPLRVVAAVAFDCDGNGRTDLLVVTEGGGVTLLNRGFGTFLASNEAHAIFHSRGEDRLPFRLTPATALAPGRVHRGKVPRQNLLVLTEEGRLFEMDNPQE